MKIRSAVYCILVTILLVSCINKKEDCEVRDISGAKTDQDLRFLKLMQMDWMKNAKVCKMGEFEIATPSEMGEKNSNIIFVFKKGKPVFYRQNSGTSIYSPKLKDASFENVMVNIWHGGDNNDTERIWYQTVGKDPEVMIYDTNFDGQPDSKTIWKNHEIIEQYKWENNGWQQKEVKNEKP